MQAYPNLVWLPRWIYMWCKFLRWVTSISIVTVCWTLLFLEQVEQVYWQIEFGERAVPKGST